MKAKALEGILKEPSVVFDEAKHTYQRRDNGDFYTGCTTISDAWDKSFFLGPWYAKEMALELRERIGDLSLALQSNSTPGEALSIIDECKGAAKRKSEQAKVDGTAAHDWMQKFVEAHMDDSLTLPPTPDRKEVLNAVDTFIGWAKAKGRKITWLASEEVICSDEHRVAGKLDAIAVIDGLTYLVDFKTSGQLSASYLLQCAGYDLMLREMGLTVMGYVIVRTPKDGTPAETLTVTDQKDMQFFRDTFLKQREAHKFYAYMESKFKDARGKMKTDTKPVEDAKAA